MKRIIVIVQVITIVLLLAIVGCSDEDINTEVKIEQTYLNYDDGSMENRITAGALDYQIWTRFTKPSDWDACRITKVKVYVDEGSQSFAIVGQDDDQYNNGYYRPASSVNWFNLDSSTSQSTGWHDHEIESDNSFNNSQFFVAVECLSSVGPYIGVDLGSYCSERSGFCGDGSNIVFTDADWGIRIYVVPATRAGERVEESEGMWLEPEVIDNNSLEFKNISSSKLSDYVE